MDVKILPETVRCVKIIQDLTSNGAEVSLRQFALTNKFHPQTISSVITEKRNVTIVLIRILIDKYNANPYFIFCDKMPMYSKAKETMVANAVPEPKGLEEKMVYAMDGLKKNILSRIEPLEGRVRAIEKKLRL